MRYQVQVNKMHLLNVVLMALFSLCIADEPFELDTIYDDGEVEVIDQSADEERDARSLGGLFSGFGLGTRRIYPQSSLLRPHLSQPLYSDAGHPGGITKPLLQANYFAQQRKPHYPSSLLSSASASQTIKSRPGPPNSLRGPLNDRRPQAPFPPSYGSKDRIIGQSNSYSQSVGSPVPLESGFIPIINGQSKRFQSPLDTSKVIHQIKPPSLAPPSLQTASQQQFKKPDQFLLSEASGTSASSAVFLKPIQPPAPLLTVPSQKLTGPHQDQVKKEQANKYNNVQYFPQRPAAKYSSSVSSRVVTNSGRSEPIQTSESSQLNRKAHDLDCDGSKDLGWCDLGDKYPKELVAQVLTQCADVLEKTHVEVPHNFEKLSDASSFKSQLDINETRDEAKERGNHDSWSWAAYYHQGSLCDAERGFLRPEVAKDNDGKWNLIVQAENAKQRIPIEMCRNPNSPCKKLSDCGLTSQCLQKYNYHLLLSIDPDDLQSCPAMKLYRFPSACVCHAS